MVGSIRQKETDDWPRRLQSISYESFTHPKLICIFGLLTIIIPIEDDVKCLEGVQTSLEDSLLKLAAWTFANTSVPFACEHVGVSCLNEKETRLISLQLPSTGLAGNFPASLQFCQSLQYLDLSGNSLSGSIPPQICTRLPYLLTLDLSGNALSGSIPSEIAECKFLNTLSGPIPYEIGRVDGLKMFSVVNNDLSGLIPSYLSKFPKESFGGNNGLCGKPLGSKCDRLSNKSLIIIISASVLGAAGSLLLSFGLWGWIYVQAKRKKKKRENGSDESSWVDSLRAYTLVQVSWFQKPINKINFNDLLAATNNFDRKNVVMAARTGASYKAMLPDGSALAIKRLTTCKLSEKQFRSKLNRLGQLRHPNLVPLLGVCVVESERFLVYKHMPNGSLYSLLHGGFVDWPARLRLGIGAARGLAWLHHGCEPPYLHQFISLSAVLVDDDFDERMTDFGLANLMGTVDSNGNLFVNGDLGEFGYVAPEYSSSSSAVASMEGDVYGFGVLLLELLTGRKPFEVCNAEEGFKRSLVDWVIQSEGRSKDAIDKALSGKGYDAQILEVYKTACACVVSRAKDRPPMDYAYQSFEIMAGELGFSRQFDEFPLKFGK